MDNQNNLLRQLLMIGIGTTSLVAEKLQEATDQWVKDGTMNTDQAKKFVDDMMQGLKLDQTSLEDLMQPIPQFNAGCGGSSSVGT